MRLVRSGSSTLHLLPLLMAAVALLTGGEAQAATPITIMPMGDSITYGVDYLTNSAGGYRDPLFKDLAAAGISASFVGANNGNATTALTNAGQTAHNGYGSWHIKDLDNNLNGSVAPQFGGDSNQGGYFLTGGHGTGRAAVTPTLLLLHAGTNDLLQGNANIDSDLYTLVTDIHALSPQTIILVAGVVPINSTGFTAAINAYNSYIKNQLVPSLSYTRYVDQNTGLLNADGTVNGNLLGADNVHPDRFGYPIMAQHWAAAIEAVEGITPAGTALTVNGGIGGGVYPAGTVLTLQANAPASGLQFSGWMTASTALSNPFSPLINYTMPSSASTLTANFAATGSPLVPNGTYEILTPYDGLAIGAVSASSGAPIQQGTYTGASTQQWTLTNLGGNQVSLTLPGTSLALEVPLGSTGTVGAPLDLANYSGATSQQWQISLAKGNLQLVNGSSGQALTIAGYATVPGAQLQQFTASGYTNQMWNLFPVAGTATQYPLVVNGGSGGGMYAAGTTVSVVANAPASGMQFSGWTGSISNLANASAASTTLITPGTADNITATYAPVSTVPVTVTSGSGTGSYPVGTAVPVVAVAPASGMQFAAWTGTTSALASTSAASTIFTVPSGGGAITATYTATSTSSASGTSLGVFSMLAESATSGNSIVVDFGQSTEGNGLTTYWAGTPAINVRSMGNSQYELVETLGGRCFTTAGNTVTLHGCIGSAGQLYTLSQQTDGSFSVQSGQGTCLNAPGSFSAITAAACTTSAAQLWQFSGTSPLVLPGATVIPPAPTPAPPPTSAPVTSTSLGTFSMLAESASQGNAIVVDFGKSTEGNGLTTYWAGAPAIDVLAVGDSQYELVETLGGRCFTVAGTSVTINTCTGGAAQLYTLAMHTDGSYTVQSMAQGTCLNAAGSFSPITAAACNGSAAQLWQFAGSTALNLPGSTPTAPVTPPAPVTAPAPTAPVSSPTLGTYSMLVGSASSGNAIAVDFGKSTEGDGLTTYWAGAPAINVVSLGNAQYELVETLGGRCITASGAAVTINTCTGSAGQMWTLTSQTNGSYTVQSTGGTCLNAAGGFAAVTALGCNNSSAQMWQFTGAKPLTLPGSGSGSTATPTAPAAPTTPTAPAAPTGIANSPTVPAGYHLTFDDEFQTLNISDTNGAGTKWYTHTVQCCMYDTSNPSTPTYMAGISDGAGKDPYSLVSGGGLDIRLQKTNGAWYSGVIATVDSTGAGFSQKYGYFEMKAKLPNAQGTWPAFWLLNTAHLNSSAPAGEIDVFEEYGQFPTYINTTLHDWSNSTQVGYDQAHVADTTVGYHVYGLLWTASTMTFYFDGAAYYTTPTPAIMNQPYYPIIDLGIGGGWPTSTTPQTNDMFIQYMRVYSN